jgi:hypothetical protein
MNSADKLIHQLYLNVFEFDDDVLEDYGYNNIDKKYHYNLSCCYQFICIYLNTPADLFNNHFLTNSLDEFINVKLSSPLHSRAGMLRAEKQKYNIGKTCKNPINCKIIDYPNDKCGKCKKIEFLPSTGFCHVCGMPLCNECVNKCPNQCMEAEQKSSEDDLENRSYEESDDELDNNYFRKKAPKSQGNMNYDNIKKKIQSCERYDKKRFGVAEELDIDLIYRQLMYQNYKCFNCKDIVKLDYEPYCLYQFSIDRIDNNKPHTIDNILIACYHCNCMNHSEFRGENKICSGGCHKNERKIINRDITLTNKDYIRSLQPKTYEISYPLNQPNIDAVILSNNSCADIKISKSLYNAYLKTSYICEVPNKIGLKLRLVRIGGKIQDNQQATYSMISLESGFAPMSFQNYVGDCIIFMENGNYTTSEWKIMYAFLSYILDKNSEYDDVKMLDLINSEKYDQYRKIYLKNNDLINSCV